MFASEPYKSERYLLRIDGIVVIAVTVGLFLAFGYNEESLWPITRKSTLELMLVSLLTAVIPTATILATYFLTSYLRSRTLAWGIYALVFFLLIAYVYPNFPELLFGFVSR